MQHDKSDVLEMVNVIYPSMSPRNESGTFFWRCCYKGSAKMRKLQLS